MRGYERLDDGSRNQKEVDFNATDKEEDRFPHGKRNS